MLHAVVDSDWLSIYSSGKSFENDSNDIFRLWCGFPNSDRIRLFECYSCRYSYRPWCEEPLAHLTTFEKVVQHATKWVSAGHQNWNQTSGISKSNSEWSKATYPLFPAKSHPLTDHCLFAITKIFVVSQSFNKAGLLYIHHLSDFPG